MEDDKESLDRIFEKQERFRRVNVEAPKSKGRFRKILLGTAIVTGIVSAAVTEHYTGFIGRAFNSPRSITETISEGAKGAYDGALSMVSGWRSEEAQLSDAKTYLAQASIQPKSEAISDIYASLPSDARERFLVEAVSGDYGDFDEAARSRISTQLMERSGDESLSGTMQKSYSLMDRKTRSGALDAILAEMPDDERKILAKNTYDGLGEEEKAGLVADLVYENITQDGIGLLEKAITSLPEEGRAWLQETAYSSLLPERQYEATKDQALRLAPHEASGLFLEVSKETFTATDFEATISQLYRISRGKYDNGPAIASGLFRQHADELTNILRDYTKPLPE